MEQFKKKKNTMEKQLGSKIIDVHCTSLGTVDEETTNN